MQWALGEDMRAASSSWPKPLGDSDIERRLTLLEREYKPNLRTSDFTSAISKVDLAYRPNGLLIDLGGGISSHNGVLAQLGMTVYVVDLLSDYWEHRFTDPTTITQEVQALEACGVRFVRADILSHDLREHFSENSVDVITSFDCVEHFHHSPRAALESAVQVLKPGGTMLIDVPNAANIRKRVALLFGRTNYLPFDEFYYNSPYLGHVREYTIGDLRQLARNLGARRYRIFGRNFIHGTWVERIPFPIRKSLDLVLQTFPGLCGSLFLEITKSQEHQGLTESPRPSWLPTKSNDSGRLIWS